MSVFNEFHYPTRDEQIDQMLAPLKSESRYTRMHGLTVKNCVTWIKYKSILESSAGQGNICDALVDRYNVPKNVIRCIEIDPDLRATLIGKGYKVIDSDFLEYNDQHYFDLVIMNPPFRYGVDHVLKGWSVVADGGTVVALLNAETLRNQNSEKRKLLARLIEEHGKVEFIGKVFIDAERSTDVDVAIVWLYKPKREAVDFGDDYDKDGYVDDVYHAENPLANKNLLAALVSQYEAARSALIESHKADAKYRFYTSGVVKRSSDVEDEAKQSLNGQIEGLKGHFWQYIFDKTTISDRATSAVKEEFLRFQAETRSMSFNLHNIGKVIDILMSNTSQIVERCIVDTFDKATSYHSENRVHTEGWKTNKSYRCNKKIIMPNGADYRVWNTRYEGSWEERSENRDFFEDIDKALCYLSGKNHTKIASLRSAILSRIDYLNDCRYKPSLSRKYQDTFESEFFIVRFYKKGTVHLFFRDQDLLDRFNIAAAQGKNWIGGGY